jgi:hypothetical protein
VTEVWVLILDHGYDGREFRGVYSTEEKAWAAHGRDHHYTQGTVLPVTIDAPAVDFEAVMRARRE